MIIRMLGQAVVAIQVPSVSKDVVVAGCRVPGGGILVKLKNNYPVSSLTPCPLSPPLIVRARRLTSRLRTRQGARPSTAPRDSLPRGTTPARRGRLPCSAILSVRRGPCHQHRPSRSTRRPTDHAAFRR